MLVRGGGVPGGAGDVGYAGAGSGWNVKPTVNFAATAGDAPAGDPLGGGFLGLFVQFAGPPGLKGFVDFVDSADGGVFEGSYGPPGGFTGSRKISTTVDDPPGGVA